MDSPVVHLIQHCNLKKCKFQSEPEYVCLPQLYGGDLTRRNKLLKYQKEGKALMKAMGKVRVPKEAYINLLKK